jgi:hypothetical protein
MATVEVSIDKIAELLGLNPTTDSDTVLAALDNFIADQQAETAAAQHRREDERIVAAAINEGKFTSSRRQFWLTALSEDRPGAKRVIAALAAVPSIRQAGAVPAVDAEMARVHELVTGRALEPTRGPRPVRAAAAQPASAPTLRDSGQPSARTVDDVNAEIMSDPEMHRAMWRMGVRDGLEPPPQQIKSTPAVEPSWDPRPRLVENPDGTAQWETPEADFGTPQWRPVTEGN